MKFVTNFFVYRKGKWDGYRLWDFRHIRHTTRDRKEIMLTTLSISCAILVYHFVMIGLLGVNLCVCGVMLLLDAMFKQARLLSGIELRAASSR